MVDVEDWDDMRVLQMLESLRVVDLKKILKKKGLKVSGVKAELLQRVKECLENDHRGEKQGDDNKSLSEEVHQKIKASPRTKKRVKRTVATVVETTERLADVVMNLGNTSEVQEKDAPAEIKSEVHPTAIIVENISSPIDEKTLLQKEIDTLEQESEQDSSSPPSKVAISLPIPISPIKEWTLPVTEPISSSSSSLTFLNMLLFAAWWSVVAVLVINEVDIWSPLSIATMSAGTLLFVFILYHLLKKETDPVAEKAQQLLNELKDRRKELKIFLSQANTKVQRAEMSGKRTWPQEQLNALKSIINTNMRILDAVEHQITEVEHYFIQRQAKNARSTADNLLKKYMT